MLATMLLFTTGGHMLILVGLLRTFHFLPRRGSADTSGAHRGDDHRPPDVFVAAVQIALPMVAVLFLADLGLALLTKVAPQLNAMNVMFPAKIGLTLLLLGLSFPVIPEAMATLVDYAQQAMAVIVGGGVTR